MVKKTKNLNTKPFLKPTPLLILSAIVLFIFLYELILQTAVAPEFRYPLMKRLFIFFAEMMVLDVAIKLIAQNKKYLLWPLQLLACLGLLYYWIIT